MSKLRDCKTCGGQVARSAADCPHCGEVLRRKTSVLTQIVGALFVLFLLVIWMAVASEAEERERRVEAAKAFLAKDNARIAAEQEMAAAVRAAHEEEVRRQTARAEAVNAAAIVAAEKKSAEQNSHAINQLKIRIEEGSEAARYSLAMRYLEGRGLPVDEAEGMRLLRLAADNGNALARSKLKRLVRE